MKHAVLHGLYAITPDGVDDDALIARVKSLLRGGVRIVQYRDKVHSLAHQMETAQALRALCRQSDALLIINDSLPLALAVDADGVHLGSDDGDLAVARRILGPGKILGASCYADFGLAFAAAEAGADYVAFGAVFTSPTKPDAVRADLSLFGRCRSELQLPACAIGGITLDNAQPVVAAGAHMLAVITDLFDAPDGEARARAYQPLFQGELA